MSESFDPYKKWLGISPKDQPPHHYRLLGLELFESDPDVVTTAADSRMALVKKFQSGQYSAISQQLLNEIAAARITLLNPEKKSQYDEILREKLKPAVKQAAPPPARKTSVPAEGGGGHADFAAIRTVTVTTKDAQAAALVSSIARRSRKPAWKTPVAVGAGALLLGAVALIVALSSQGDGKAVSEQPVSPSDQPATPPQKTGKTKQTGDQQPKENGPKTPAGKTPEIKTPEAKTAENPPEPLPKEEPKVPSEPDPNRTLANLLDPSDGDVPAKEEVPAKPPPEPKPEEPLAAKPSLPDDAALQQAKKRVREVYGQEVAAAKAAKDKLAICDKMIKQGNAEKNDAAIRCALYLTARDLAAELLNPDQSFAAVDAIAASFDVDPLAMKADLLDEMSKAFRGRPGPSEQESLQQIVAAATALSEASLVADDFTAAARCLEAGGVAARKTGDAQLIRDLTVVRKSDLKKAKAQYAAAKAAIDAVAANPDDVENSLKAGQWYCFQKRDWQRGLPLLAKGGNAKLSELASRDLAGPKSSAEQVQLADAWWELGDKDHAAKTAVQSRAAYWYEEALPGLSGFDKTKVEKRLETVYVSQTRGAVKAGNVALASLGAKLLLPAGADAKCLFDREHMKQGDLEFVAVNCPGDFVIDLGQVYSLREIRLRLYDKDTRFHRYEVHTSPDGANYKMLHDCSRGEWRGWQHIPFPALAVKTVKIRGLHNSNNPAFLIMEFEAYCISPNPRKNAR